MFVSRTHHSAKLALVALVLVGSARAGPSGEVAPEAAPEPESASPPAPPSEATLILVSRVGSVFATTFFRPPIELPNSYSRAGEPVEGAFPAVFALGRVTPNPLLAQARIGLDLPVASRVRFEVLDVAGRVVRTLVDGPIAPGRHSLAWDGTDAAGRELSPGIYFLRMAAQAANGGDGIRRVDKVLVLK